MIYQLVIHQIDLIARNNRNKFPPGAGNQRMIKQPALFRICRSIRSEAVPLFYQLRDFHILAEGGTETLKTIQSWMRLLAPSSLQNVRCLRITFRQTFKTIWVLFLNYYRRKLPLEAAIYVHAMVDRDGRKFREIRSEYKALNPGHIPRLDPSASDWYYPWRGLYSETGRSVAQLTFPALPPPLRTPVSTPTKARSMNSSPVSVIDLTQDPKKTKKCVTCGRSTL